jgi:mRNA-degrading endonuclease RelE of RelBE toxin-antitoxin system
MFELKLTLEAIEDLRFFSKADRKWVVNETERRLGREPAVETRNRKRLRPNRVAEWELRIDQFRIFYDVDSENRLIKVRAVAYKEGNTLYVRGRKFSL